MQRYKIRLESGRILGPLDLARVRALIEKKHITGKEFARILPDGEWRDIHHIPELSQLILKALQPNTTETIIEQVGLPDDVDVLGETLALPTGEDLLPGADLPTGSAVSIGSIPELEADGRTSALLPSSEELERHQDEGEKTMIAESLKGFEPEDGTMIASPIKIQKNKTSTEDPSSPSIYEIEPKERPLSQESTVVFEGRVPNRRPEPPGAIKATSEKKSWGLRKTIVIASALATILYFGLLEEPEERTETKRPKALLSLKARMPNLTSEISDPKRSDELYFKALGFYGLDHVEGYHRASELLMEAINLDHFNAKAIALLASCYLNLMDSIQKDQTYFDTITKLIEASKAKTVDLTESVIADVEFLTMLNRSELAVNRVVDFTRIHSTWALDMFYFIALAYFSRDEYATASRYVMQIPDDKVFSAKVFYMRGQIAERLGTPQDALLEYSRALKMNRFHARSHLKFAQISRQEGVLNQASKNIDFLIAHPQLSSPRDLAEANFLAGVLLRSQKKLDRALAFLEKSVSLRPHHPPYLLELYTAQYEAGADLKEVQAQARMYYFLGLGETLAREGKYDSALKEYLSARESARDLVLPLLKMAQMFSRIGDHGNARINLEKATELLKKNPAANKKFYSEVWINYIQSLIRSYEWDQATKAIAQLQKSQLSRSALFRLNGDLAALQGQMGQALQFYQMAMKQESIDQSVYLSYAQALNATGKFKESPFFFSLVLRDNPLDIEAIAGLARAVSEAEGVDVAIRFLEEEQRRQGAPRAELSVALGELLLRKGDALGAERLLKQAMTLDPGLASPWKVLARVHLAREGVDKRAVERALDAYKSYSDRNSSDPSGYYERYRIFLKMGRVRDAETEIDRILTLFPNYPGLHIHKGDLYKLRGESAVAMDEYKKELELHPLSADAYLAIGQLHLDQEDGTNALTQLKKAMDLAPLAAEPKHLAGYANYLLRNYEGAAALYQAALNIEQNNPLVYKRHGLALQRLGRNEEAKASFRKYLDLDPGAADRSEIERYL
jgi:tetratricopeptide (TPR) repeat protein